MANRLLGAVALGAVALAAGCGSGSSSTTAGQDDLASQANAVCKKVNDQVAALPKPTTYAGAVAVGAKELQYAKEGEAQLQTITPPAGQQAEWDKFLAAVESQTPLAEKLVAALKAHDSTAARALGKQLQASSPDAIAKSLGLTECAKNVSPSG